LKRKNHQRFNPKRQKLIKLMAKGKTMNDASLEAGYSCPQAASNALRTMRKTMPELMDNAGLTDEALIKNHLLPLLKAKKTIYFQNGGVVMDKREVADLGIRQSSLDMAFRLKNKYPNTLNVEHSGVILHMMTETERVEAVESLKRIAAFEGDEESENVIDGEIVET
jgi:hypothetical protein